MFTSSLTGLSFWEAGDLLARLVLRMRSKQNTSLSVRSASHSEARPAFTTKVDEAAYRDLRERNNVAVRKSRAKSRAFKSSMLNKYNELKTDNIELKKVITSRLKEMHFLRFLLARAHRSPPKRLHELLAASQKNGPLGLLLYSNLNVPDGPPDSVQAAADALLLNKEKK
ncbi:unnamed protein product [Calicophoron daubneyi]|uniref:BZIP domain-containing protein n=1 Tax=Calicophoron daubneyi TaxID=300641 RepID=A0AAV2T8C9_CALDB